MRYCKGIIMLLMVCVVIGCGESEQAIVQEVYDYERDSLLIEGYEEELPMVQSAVWETAKGYEKMITAGFKYSSLYSLAPARVSQYITNKEKALGLGAFCSYVSYATMNGQFQDALNGLNAILKLADDLKVRKAFDKDLLTEIIKSAKDSTIDVAAVLQDAVDQAEKHMHSNNRAELATIMIAGGWIEAMYVSLSMVNANYDKVNDGIKLSVWSHSYKYQSVMKLLAIFEDSKDCRAVEGVLKDLRKPVWGMMSSPRGLSQQELVALQSSIGEARQSLLA
ncbi:MAG: hypothetical protein HRT72_12675 [Flavobacteriales bacterium]|nr:hypothetical protein [Flavobacteriales bacterium]